MRNCPKCNLEIKEQFDECWKCARENPSSEEEDLITYTGEANDPGIMGENGELIIHGFGHSYSAIIPTKEPVSRWMNSRLCSARPPPRRHSGPQRGVPSPPLTYKRGFPKTQGHLSRVFAVTSSRYHSTSSL
jgi:hypothetical protein